tara:strand:- start:2376 stop:2534 length:159 start_codon:yes stop_codon:yes gene_type:complete
MTDFEFIISIVVMLVVICLIGRYALLAGLKIEQHKKFERNMNNFDKKNKTWK